MVEEEQKESGKKRVNLYLDEEVVNRCKELGINLSRVTSDILEGVPDSASTTENAYRALFQKIAPILKHYNTSTVIGKGNLLDGPGLGEISLEPDGTFRVVSEFITKTLNHTKLINHYSNGFSVFLILDLFTFLKDNEDFELSGPRTIFSDLIQSIKSKKERDQERVRDIDRIMRIISAIEPDLLEKTSKGTTK